MLEAQYDIAIIGAGPAGITAFIYARRAGLNAVIVESSPLVGGQIMDTYEIENYPGFYGLSGMELCNKFTEHLNQFQLNQAVTTVDKIVDKGEIKELHTPNEIITCKNIILCSGAEHRTLGIPGEAELKGMGVSYCATCDGAFFRGRNTVVIGGGDVAVEDAIFLSRFCKKVYLVHRRDKLRAARILQDRLFAIDNIEVIWDSVPLEIQSNKEEGVVQYLEIKNVKTEEKKLLEVDGVFIAVGIVPRSQLVKDIVDINEGGYVITDKHCRTSKAGIYACGDVRDTPLRQVITACADGAIAVSAISG